MSALPNVTEVEFNPDGTVTSAWSDEYTRVTAPLELLRAGVVARTIAVQHFLERKQRICPTPRI